MQTTKTQACEQHTRTPPPPKKKETARTETIKCKKYINNQTIKSENSTEPSEEKQKITITIIYIAKTLET